MMPDPVKQIVHSCLAIDTVACCAYDELSRLAEAPELRDFWAAMSAEERTHVDFWSRVCAHAEQSALPQVFDDPEAVRLEVEKIVPRARALLDRCREACGVAEAFLLAYRLEFYLLHPAFETLFHVMRHVVGEPCPEDQYEMHVDRFVQMLARHSPASPELELLGETLGRLWKENRRLAEQSTRDPVTGLLTRRAFSELSVHLAHLCQRQGQTVGVIMLDVDCFKEINDAHGHPAGDQVLRDVATAVLSSVRHADLVGRYGGEEFVVLLPGTDKEAAPLVAERLRASVERARPRGITTTISLGLVTASLRAPEGDLAQLIREADACLYAAKREGRNRVVIKHLE